MTQTDFDREVDQQIQARMEQYGEPDGEPAEREYPSATEREAEAFVQGAALAVDPLLETRIERTNLNQWTVFVMECYR